MRSQGAGAMSRFPGTHGASAPPGMARAIVPLPRVASRRCEHSRNVTNRLSKRRLILLGHLGLRLPSSARRGPPVISTVALWLPPLTIRSTGAPARTSVVESRVPRSGTGTMVFPQHWREALPRSPPDAGWWATAGKTPAMRAGLRGPGRIAPFLCAHRAGSLDRRPRSSEKETTMALTCTSCVREPADLGSAHVGAV
jgi:hypothetical protein